MGALPKKRVEGVTGDFEAYHDFIVRDAECKGWNDAIDNVEAIINRLIP